MSNTGYLRLEGMSQGEIKGDCTQAGYEGCITVVGVDSGIILPTNPITGMPTGQRQHQPFIITKTQGGSSPLIYQACTTGEHMKKFDLRYIQINDQGQEVEYFQVVLENAIIVSIQAFTPLTFLAENKPYEDMEKIAFAFSKITWTNLTEQTEASDDWAERKSG